MSTPHDFENEGGAQPQGEGNFTMGSGASSSTSGQAGSTPIGRIAESAREQAGVAADALRRGEFMSDATVDMEANQDDKLIALLSYVTQIIIPLIMPVIILLSESSKKRPFQRYHAVQS